MGKKKSAGRAGAKADKRLFTLKVSLMGGPISASFAANNKHVVRTIQIRGDQTLEDLHEVIFRAFDRYDPHMYEFQIGGKGPMDPDARRYVLPVAMNDPLDMGEEPEGTVATPLGELGLRKDDVFGYWFDFGDEWWHQIDVLEIAEIAESAESAGRGRYPKITDRIGPSPPQYTDPDEDDPDEDDPDEDDPDEADPDEE